MFAQEPDDEDQQIIEVGSISLLEQFLIAKKDAREFFFSEGRGLLAGLFRRGHVVFPVADSGQRGARREGSTVELQLLQDRTDQLLLIRSVVDGEAAAIGFDPVQVATKQPGTEGVKGTQYRRTLIEIERRWTEESRGRKQLPTTWAQQGDGSTKHLIGGLVGESDGKDRSGRYPGRDEVGDAMGHHPGLAAARACDHRHRPPVAGDGLLLARIQCLGHRSFTLLEAFRGVGL